MAETTVLRSSASPRNASPGVSSATPYVATSSALPLVNVVMGGVNGKSAVVQGQGAPAKQGVVVMPLKNQGPQPQLQRGPGGFVGKVEVTPLPPKAPPQTLSSDHLLLLRHLTTRFLDDQRAEGSDENAQLAEATLAAIDQSLTDIAAAAAAPAPAPVRRVVAASPRSNVPSGTPRRVPTRPAAPPPVVEDNAIVDDDVIDIPPG